MVKIWKLLPNGRRVERDVTPQEYMTAGWATNGWAAPSSLQKQFEKKVEDDTERELRTHSNSYLQSLLRRYTIAKKLPNGRFVHRTVTGAEFEHEGWRTQGWFIPSYAREKVREPLETKTAKDKYIDAILRTQKWWKPKRSYAQALSFYKPVSSVIGDELGHSTRDDTAGLMQHTHQINPAWRDWEQKAVRWAQHNRPRYLRLTTQEPSPLARRMMWKNILHGYNTVRKAPPKVIPIDYRNTVRQRRYFRKHHHHPTEARPYEFYH